MKKIKKEKISIWNRNMILSLILTVILFVVDKFFINVIGTVDEMFFFFFIWILLNQFELLERK